MIPTNNVTLMIEWTWLGLLCLSLVNFQGAPDYIPLLPYLSIWTGWLLATVIKWPALLQLAPLNSVRSQRLLGGLILMGLSAYGVFDAFTYVGPSVTLDGQKQFLRHVVEALPAGAKIQSVGAPEFLALSGLENASRYVYFYNGVDDYIAEYEAEGTDGYLAQLEAEKPALVVVVRERGSPISEWISQHYIETETMHVEVDYSLFRCWPGEERPSILYVRIYHRNS